MQAIVVTPGVAPLPLIPASASLNPHTLPMAQDSLFTGMEKGGTVEMQRRRRRRYR